MQHYIRACTQYHIFAIHGKEKFHSLKHLLFSVGSNFSMWPNVAINPSSSPEILSVCELRCRKITDHLSTTIIMYLW